MALRPYPKPHATAAQRVSHLQSNGLHIPDLSAAAHSIDLIGYERLRIYCISRRDPNLANRPFISGTTYQDILDIYECDQHLREACFSAVGQFEILFRNAVSETLSQGHGTHPYDDVTAFGDPTKHLETLQMFGNIYQYSKDPRAHHYRKTYDTPLLPPIWTMKEFLTFGATARIFQRLSGPNKTAIAQKFNIPSDAVFLNWVECLVDLRNMCAHHDRLFNRTFQKQPQYFKRQNLPAARKNTLKAILECLDYLLTSRGLPRAVTADVNQIISRCPVVRPAEAGY